MTPFIFVLAALATYRLTVMIARDVGPWNIFKRLRKVARFSKLLSCPFCVSIWAAALIDIAIQLSGYRDTPVVVGCQILALSAIAIILDRCFTSDVTN